MAKAQPNSKLTYHEPEVIDYGKVADLTRKPGSRGDGSPGTKGDKGMGS